MAMPLAAQEVVTIPTRPGVKQSFFIANMGGRKPEAVALLFVGGEGAIKLQLKGGQPSFQQGNFLPRSRREFIRNGVVPVIVDTPSDHADGISDEFRMSDQHRFDVQAVVSEMKKRYPGLPVFIVGTSRSSISAAYLGRGLGGEVAGVVLSSSAFLQGPRTNPRPMLSGFNWSTIKVPVLVVHHLNDGCFASPYYEAKRLAGRYPLVSVSGGKPPESGPCDPFAPHGYFGMEAQTVDAIAAWMLGKPFSKEIR